VIRIKKKIATRKLKKKCIYCNKSFLKGEVYYKQREIYTDYSTKGSDIVIASEYLICPKCKYKNGRHKERFDKFKYNCNHPIWETVWDYIPGECIKEPQYDVCVLCGTKSYDE